MMENKTMSGVIFPSGRITMDDNNQLQFVPGFTIYYKDSCDAIDKEPNFWFYPSEEKHYDLELIAKFRVNHPNADIVKITRRG